MVLILIYGLLMTFLDLLPERLQIDESAFVIGRGRGHYVKILIRLFLLTISLKPILKIFFNLYR